MESGDRESTVASRRRWLVGIAMASAAGLAACGTNTTPGPNETQAANYTIRVVFDGGYTGDFTQHDAVNFHAVGGGPFPMHFKVITETTPTEVDATGYIVSLHPDGTMPSATKPGIPPLDTDPKFYGCNKTNDESLPNNLLFIPSLRQAAKAMDTDVEVKPGATFRLTGGGDVRVEHLGGCVQPYSKGAKDGLPRSMASGRGGITYDWRGVPGTRLVLKRTPLGGGTAIDMDLTPNKNGYIVIRVSAKFSILEEVLAGERYRALVTAPVPPYDVDFKEHFEKAFKVYDAMKYRLEWLHSYYVSPGIDCPLPSEP